jgi:hypothetical protein
MEPRQYKLLSEIFLAIGVVLAAIGIATIYLYNESTIGAIFLIVGCGCALISLPTFMILTMVTLYREIK